MEKTGAILAIFLTVFLFLSVSVVYAQPEHSESYCQVSNVDLNAQGEYLEIEAGGTIEISLDYEIWNRIGCPGCFRQIVIGLNRDPLFCAYDGIPGTHPGVKGSNLLVITAPTEPGTYIIRWMCTSMYTCNDAKDKYRESDYLGYTIGTIIVTDNGNHDSYCEVSNIDLNGQGSYLEVKPGETVRMDATYRISDSNECPGCRQQIVIGLDNGVPLYCAFDGIPGVQNGIQDGVCEVTAPTEPGTYNVMWMCAIEYTCNNAKNKYTLSPSLWKKIGTIKVMDCSGGICDTYCEVKGILLNGQHDYLETKPGETIKITIYYEIWNPIDRPEITQQIVIGLEDNPMYCAYNGIPGIHPGILDHDQVFYEMTAPTEPGTYDIMWLHTMGYTCDDAKNLYFGLPLLREKIGTIKVTGDEVWKLIHYKNYPREDYKIINMSFYQQGNNLRVHIDELREDSCGLRSGSVSISVPESIVIFYDNPTTNVTGLHFREDNYRKINPEMSLAEKSLKFAVTLLEGKLGIILGIAQFGAEVKPDKLDWHEEDELTGRALVFPRYYFDWYDMLNENDIVVIPWYVGIDSPVCAIRVDCPEMQFPGPGIYDMVFRVDYAIGWTDIRYDVALPITVT